MALLRPTLFKSQWYIEQVEKAKERKRFHFKEVRVNGAGQPQEMGRMHAFGEKKRILIFRTGERERTVVW